MLRRFGYRLPMVGGFVVMSVGLVLMAISPHGVTPYVWLAGAAAITGIGMGTAQPAANNAMMQLAPSEVPAVAGLRGMIRQSGSIVAVSVVTALAARSSHPGITLGHVFIVFAVLLVISLPLIRFVPEHHGSW
jgi:MFS family permease